VRELIRARFAGPGISPDASGDGSGWERGQNVVPPEKLVNAAVLVPIVDRRDGFTVLLTQRTEHLPSHAGQVAFPGGRSHGPHESPEDTALREAEEEIGLTRDQVEVIGRLNVRFSGTGFRVTPVVGLITPPFELRPDPREVAAVFEVPLSLVLDPASHTLKTEMRNGAEREFYVLTHPERYIWGLTARMLLDLSRVLEKIES
jgi:8-oxo-dGTP pyrophosphatase MutT (NUDIX family)